MTRKEALESLLAKVEDGTLGQMNWRDFAELEHPFRATGEESRAILAHRAYRGSLDAAKALHEAVLPLYDYRIEYRTGVPRAIAFTGGTNSLSWSERITNDDPARAWLIAILKAMIAQEQE